MNHPFFPDSYNFFIAECFLVPLIFVHIVFHAGTDAAHVRYPRLRRQGSSLNIHKGHSVYK